MRLDEFVREWDVRERHVREIDAPAATVRRAVDTYRPPKTPMRFLFALRRVPAPTGTLREWARSLGFVTLADEEDELVLGQIGRFWVFNEPEGLASPGTAEEFRAFSDPSYAVAAMNMRVEPLGDSRSRLSTETRVRALGTGSRWRMRLYWLLIRPWSGLLRREMLRGIAREAEV